MTLTQPALADDPVQTPAEGATEPAAAEAPPAADTQPAGSAEAAPAADPAPAPEPAAPADHPAPAETAAAETSSAPAEPAAPEPAQTNGAAAIESPPAVEIAPAQTPAPASSAQPATPVPVDVSVAIVLESPRTLPAVESGVLVVDVPEIGSPADGPPAISLDVLRPTTRIAQLAGAGAFPVVQPKRRHLVLRRTAPHGTDCARAAAPGSRCLAVPVVTAIRVPPYSGTIAVVQVTRKVARWPVIHTTEARPPPARTAREAKATTAARSAEHGIGSAARVTDNPFGCSRDATFMPRQLAISIDPVHVPAPTTAAPRCATSTPPVEVRIDRPAARPG